MGRVYVTNNGNAGASISTAITVLQLTAAAANPCKLLRAVLSQSGSTTSAQVQIAILRKTATITGTTGVVSQINPSDAASGATSLYTATAEGTDSSILVNEAFNVINGWVWLPTPEERIIVPGGGIIALKFLTAPASEVWYAEFFFEEEG